MVAQLQINYVRLWGEDSILGSDIRLVFLGNEARECMYLTQTRSFVLQKGCKSTNEPFRTNDSSRRSNGVDQDKFLTHPGLGCHRR